MTDEKRPIRQISGNLEKFQAAMSELTGITVKVDIHEAFVEGKLEALKAASHLLSGTSRRWHLRAFLQARRGSLNRWTG
jgi:hypothetical protein